MKRILIIEDDESIADIEKDYLGMSGYSVEIENNGESGLAACKSGNFDLVILDIMLPGRDGFSILEKLGNDRKFPIIIVSAKDEEFSKIKGLTQGADDYMTKPFSMGELVARVNSHIKTYERLKADGIDDDIMVSGTLTVNEAQRRVFSNGVEVSLKQKEFELLVFLMKNAGRVFSKEQLFERIWGFDAISDASTVTVHIARLRDKIEKDPARPEFVTTVWGAGYRFNNKN